MFILKARLRKLDKACLHRAGMSGPRLVDRHPVETLERILRPFARVLALLVFGELEPCLQRTQFLLEVFDLRLGIRGAPAEG